MNQKLTKKKLKQKLLELKGLLPFSYYSAHANLDKAGFDSLKGSGVLITMHKIGGEQLTPPFLVRDGLSPEAIAELRKEINRSWKLATEIKPGGCRN